MTEQPRPAPPGATLSPDGLYWWDGSHWVPAAGPFAPGPALPTSYRPAPQPTLHDGGNWDTTAWQPSREVPASGNSRQVPWYLSSFFVVVAWFFVTPLGLLLIWKKPDLSQRAKWTWTGVTAALVGIGVIAAVAGAHSQGTTGRPAAAAAPLPSLTPADLSTQDSQPQSLPAETQPPDTPPPSFSVGDTIPTTAGNAFTVTKYVDHFASSNEFDSPPPGGFYAAIDVKVCAGDAALSVNPASFTLVEPDDSRIDTMSGPAGGRTPELNFTNLQPHECVSGWINYGVIAKPKQVALENSDLRWSVP